MPWKMFSMLSRRVETDAEPIQNETTANTQGSRQRILHDSQVNPNPQGAGYASHDGRHNIPVQHSEVGIVQGVDSLVSNLKEFPTQMETLNIKEDSENKVTDKDGLCHSIERKLKILEDDHLLTGHIPMEMKSDSEFATESHGTESESAIKLSAKDYVSMPDDLKLKHVDILLITGEKDYENGNWFKKFLETITYTCMDGTQVKCEVLLLSDIHLRGSHFTNIEKAQDCSTYIFLLITKHFCSDAWAEFQKDDSLVRAITTPHCRWSIVPVYTLPKNELTIPSGLRSLKGLGLDKYLKGESYESLLHLKESEGYLHSYIRSTLEAKSGSRQQREDEQIIRKNKWVREKESELRRKKFLEEKNEGRRQLQEEKDFEYFRSSLLDSNEVGPSATSTEGHFYGERSQRSVPEQQFSAGPSSNGIWQLPPPTMPTSNQHGTDPVNPYSSAYNMQPQHQFSPQHNYNQLNPSLYDYRLPPPINPYVHGIPTSHQVPSDKIVYNITANNVQIGPDNVMKSNDSTPAGVNDADILERKYNPEPGYGATPRFDHRTSDSATHGTEYRMPMDQTQQLPSLNGQVSRASPGLSSTNQKNAAAVSNSGSKKNPVESACPQYFDNLPFDGIQMDHSVPSTTVKQQNVQVEPVRSGVPYDTEEARGGNKDTQIPSELSHISVRHAHKEPGPQGCSVIPHGPSPEEDLPYTQQTIPKMV